MALGRTSEAPGTMDDQEPLTSDRATVVPHQFEAAAFDLDGVVTDTARVHAEAWTRVFDALLRERTTHEGTSFKPFTSEDYRTYVDGRPRLEAIRAFLLARGVSLPEGEVSDGQDVSTIHGLGARKNQLFLEHIQNTGVDIYPSTVALIRRLRSLGLKTAIVSSILTPYCGRLPETLPDYMCLMQDVAQVNIFPK